MKYKQKLATVEAFHYEGDFKKLSNWFVEHSIHGTIPFHYIGREPQIFNDRGQGVSIVPGCYVVLLPDGKRVNIQSQEEFESSHTIPKEEKKEV